MAPGGSGKRKRGDRTWSGDSIDRQRPSPHRPENLNLAQQSQGQYGQGYGRDQDNSRGRGGRRPSRGGRGGSTLRSPTGPPRNSANQLKSPITLQPISPPTNQSRRDQKDVPKANVQPLPGPTTSITAEGPPAAKPKPQPYYYEHLSGTRIQSWDSIGKREVVKKGTEARSKQDYTALSCLFQELVRSGLDGRIPFEETGATIKEIIGNEVPVGAPTDTKQSAFRPSPFDARIVFLDTLSILTDSDNENPDLRPIVLSTSISVTLMRQILETPLLQSLGLIRDTFARMGIRKQTNLLYRQSNYNLLREESEGYSKLLTELFTTSNNGAFSSSVVEDTFERVKAMVGAFDMDVGRVLDVTLDVFAAVVVRQNKFFVKLLRTSSWWPKDDEVGENLPHQFQVGLPKWALPDASSNAGTDQDTEKIPRSNEERDRLFWARVQEVGIKAYFELGRRLAPVSNLANSLSDLNDPPGADFDEDQRWIRETGTLPPRGNRVAAQLLGFKLRFYSSPTRDPSDTLPENLIWLTALLIKIGFVSLRDLYPHLWPTDEAMETLREKKMAERAKAERDRRQGAGSQNALAMAGALADDTLTGPPLSRAREVDPKPGTPAKTEESDKIAPGSVEEKDVLPEAKDQKVQLLKSLLAIGALPESLYILARFPWLLDAYADLPSFICRILHQSLSKVYSVVEPPPIFGSNDQAPAPDVDQSGIPKGHIRLGQYPARRVLKWAELDAQESPSDANSYRFYWEEWTDNIPCCQSVDDVFLLCGSFLNLLGVKIGLDAPLVTKIARIGKDSLQKDHSESNRSRWLDLCKRLLVPALSLTSREPGVVNEVWEILKQYPRDTRYSVYAEWYQGQISRLPDIKAAFDRTQAETKDALKRISKTNTKHMARVLAKVAYSSPGIVINAAIAQIEAYDNLIQVVIACARYFSALGYDVMTWCLLTALGQKGRNRVQADGMLTSKWLLALATFTGKIFKQYERTDCSPVLQYVAEQLRQNNSTDLIILENLTSTMGGIVSDASFNDAQIQAMGGGNLLQLQTMLQLHDKRNDTKGGSRRLMRALTDTQLAGQLLISISQERKTCIFRVAEEDAHLKLLGNLLDEIHRTLTQYLDLLRHNLTVEEFDKLVPDTSTLIGDFGIEPEIAFWINRESIAWAMAEADRAAQELNEKRKSEALAVQHAKDVNGDVAMADSQLMASETKIKTTQGGGQNVVQSEDAANGEPGEELKMDTTTSDPPVLSPLPPVDGNGDSTPWHAVLQDQMDKLSHVLPKEAIVNLGLPFYVTFWQLSLFDLHIPGKAYEDEIARQKKNAITIGNDRSDPSSAGAKRREALKKDAVNLADQLLAENKSHLKLYTQTRARLQKEKELWFAGMRGKYELLSIALLEQCLLPRIFLSPVDSFYCFKMFKYLHSSGTPNFRTMVLLDQLFKEHRLTSLIFLCTSKEAENLGRFLCDALRDLNRWHSDKALYEKEAYGPKKDLPGFARSAPDAEGKLSNFLDFEDFRRLLYRWHQQVGNAFKNCFTGEEYMHIRNAIVMLKAVHQVFPAINWMGQAQVGLVSKLSESEGREDLKIAATSLLGNLRRREKQWILPQAFRISESTVNGVNGVRSTPSTPVPFKAQPIAQKTMNATAPNFKPSVTQNNIQAQASGRLEVEDGEIEDAKMTDIGTTRPVDVSQPTGQIQPASQEQPDTTSIVAEKAESRQGSAAPAPSLKAAQADLPPPSCSTPTPATNVLVAKDTDTLSAGSALQKDKPNSDQAPRPDIPRRPDIDRGATTASAGGFRSHHNLPSRPEPRNYRQPDARIPPRPPISSALDDRRDPRDSRPQDYGRSSRLADQDRDRTLPREDVHGTRELSRIHERGILDREREREREYHDPHRLSDRGNPPRGPDDRLSRPPSRETRGSVREPEWQERSARSKPQDPYPARGDREHVSRDAMAPPQAAMAAHPERAALIQQHSEREPQSSGDRDRRSDMPKVDGEDRRNRLSRPTSPRRQNDRGPRGDRHDERPSLEERHAQSEPISTHVNSHTAKADAASSGPRDRDRASRLAPFEQNLANDVPRDPRPPLPAPVRFESTHGRLNQDSRYPRQDGTALDRKNAPAEIPSGPRARPMSGRGGRGGSAIQPHINTQISTQLNATTHERQPPTGPASGRPHMRNSSHHDQASSAPASAPSTPTVQPSETAGIHPDRLKAIQSPVEESNPSTIKTGGPRPSVHALSPASGAPPSGPRSSQMSPIAPQPTRGPPVGPAFGPGERGRGDKRFASLQQTLAGGQDRGAMGTSIRGRGARQGGPPNQSPQTSTPPTPGPEPYASAQNGRPDLFASRSSDPPQHGPDSCQTQQNQSEDQRLPPARRRPEPDASVETRRSARHSSSRTHSVEREGDRDRRVAVETDARLLRSGSAGRREDQRDNRELEHARDHRSELNSNHRDALQEGRDRREVRESTSRRLRDDAGISNPPPKRQRRNERDEYESGYDRRALPPPLPPPPPPPHQAPTQSQMEEERRWGGRDHRDARDRDSHRDDRVRDRERDRERDRRDGGSGGAHNIGSGSLRKRGRPLGGDEGESDRDGAGRGSVRGGVLGMRGENKRPRRGPP